MPALALDSRLDEDVLPLSPVHLPEFRQSVSWLMCRNPMCGRFGVPFDGPSPSRREKSVGDVRCRIDLVKPQFRCRDCGHSFQPPSSAGIRVLARHFLAQSLPFADCPDQDCENHGWSVFEHWAPVGEGRGRRYRSNGRHEVVCRKCGRRISLGEPLRLHSVAKADGRRRSVRRLVGQAVDVAMLAKSLRQGLHAKRLGEGAYYACLLRSADRVRDYLAWRAAKLGIPRFARVDEPLRVQTDVLEVSLKRLGLGPRHQPLSLIVSVVNLQLNRGKTRTWFILAAHPAFLPEALCPDFFELQDDRRAHVLARRWDCLAHDQQVDNSRGSRHALATFADSSRAGFFVNSPHAELAHFLVVRRMLSRFPKVHHCVDGDRSLRAAALTALSGDVRSGRVEIALFQHRKQDGRAGVGAGGKRESERRAQALDDARRSVDGVEDQRAAVMGAKARSLEAARRDMEARFDGKLAGQSSLPAPLGESSARARAKAFRSAFKGAHSESGGWAWLEHPVGQRQYVDARTLWLTEAPGKDWDAGRELMLHATLQSVDSAFNSMRERVRAVGRPDFRATPGRGYRGSNFAVDVVMAEVWLYLLARNYTAGAYAGVNSMLPAQAMGLMPRNGRQPDVLDVAWTFRLGVEHAAKLSKWLMRK